MTIFARNFCLAGLAFLLSFVAHAGTFSYDCGQSEVSCDGLFADMVTEKFTRTFDYKLWTIFVYADNAIYSKGNGVSSVIVGVVKKENSSGFSYFPNRWWTQYTSKDQMGSAFQQQDTLRQTIRRAVEAMMAACEDSPNCDIIERNGS